MQTERVFGIFQSGRQDSASSKDAIGPISGGERFKRRLLIHEFAPPESMETIPKSEKRAFRHLVRAVRRWAEVYSIQEGPDERAHFYPPNITRNQITRAAEEDSEILSPYTVVLRNQDNSLFTVPMHEAYSRIIEATGVIGLLKKAAKETKDKKLKEYLKAKAYAIRTGNWQESERIWLERVDEPDIDIVIGFYDTYTDKFLGRKYAAEAWAGVLNRDATSKSQEFLDAFLNNWSQKTNKQSPRVKMRIDETRIMSGQAGLYQWTANSLPCQIEWRKKYGSKFVIFEPEFIDLYNERAAAFSEHIHPSNRSGLPKPLIWTGTLRRYIGHEIGHSLVEEGIEERIGAHKNWFNELYCDLLSLKGYFDIPKVFTHRREREVAFATLFANGFLDNTAYQNGGRREEYLEASAIILKHCLDRGAIQAVDGCISWTNPTEVITSIAELFEDVERLQKEGLVKDVEQFKAQKLDKNIYKKVLRTANSS